MKRIRHTGAERRGEIEQAVLAILAEQGTGALSVAAVAQRVGIAPSALYRHYRDKDAIVAETMERLAAGVAANLARAAASTDAPLDALGELLARHLDFVREHRGFPLLLFSDLVLQSPGRRQRMQEILAGFRASVAALLERARDLGQVRADVDLDTAAFVYLGLFVPVGIQYNLSGGRFDLAAHARRAWPLFLSGVRNAAPSPPAARRRVPAGARAALRPHRQERSK